MPEFDDRGDAVSSTLYNVETSDPNSRLIDRADLAPEEMSQIGRLMSALGKLREAEQVLAAR